MFLLDGFFRLRFVKNRITVSENGLFPVCVQGTISGVCVVQTLYKRRAVCTLRVPGGYVCSPAPFCSGSRRALPHVAVAGGALGPAVSCAVSSWLPRRVLWAYVLRAAQEGGAGFTVGHSKGLSGSSVWQGRPLLCNVLSKHDDTCCFSFSCLRQIIQTHSDVSIPYRRRPRPL